MNVCNNLTSKLSSSMSGVSLQSIVSQGTVEVVCGAMVGTYTGGLNAESRPHGYGGRCQCCSFRTQCVTNIVRFLCSCVFRTMTDHHEFVGLWQDGVPKLGVTKVSRLHNWQFSKRSQTRWAPGLPTASRCSTRILSASKACRRWRGQR